MGIVKLSHEDISHLCDKIGKGQTTGNKVYPIPRGGIPATYALQGRFPILKIVDNPADADFFMDDIIDSGFTMREWAEKYPNTPFHALVDKLDPQCKYIEDWIVFPWEGDAAGGIESNIIRILQFAGDDPKREGLLETPARVARALEHWFSGYGGNAAELLKVFEDGSEHYDQMVVVKDIPIYSKCEHHMADIFGTATIAYIPDGKIVGLSKLSRLADMYARRLQVQERLTQQIANALHENLQPLGVGVMIKARHMCMESRGICQQGHHTITTSIHGAFKNCSATRAEFMAIARQ